MTTLPHHPSVNLPSGSTLVEDVDEEIFLLYTRKQQLSSESTGAPEGSAAKATGLGAMDREGVLNVSLAVANPWAVAPSGGGKKSARSSKAKGKQKEEVVVEVELHQSLDALRNRKGDTGSVLWRMSIHLAQLLLTQHHFLHPSVPPLLPNLSTSSVLELGSGTAFLGIALRSVFSPPPTSASDADAPPRPNWTFSDQLVNLDLVLRNLRANELDPTSPSVSSSSPRVAIEELDWLYESSLFLSASPSSPSPAPSSFLPPDLILAIDCIYNPSLSAPLAHTILRRAGKGTVVLVASELRDEEALEGFLRAWMEDGERKGEVWRIWRLEWEGEEGRGVGEVKEGKYVVWVGWKESGEDKEK